MSYSQRERWALEGSERQRSLPQQWGQAILIPAATAAGFRAKLLEVSDVSADGLPLRATVSTTAVRRTNGGLVGQRADVIVTTGVGGTRQEYRIDAGSALTVSADALSVAVALRQNASYDLSVSASIARWGDVTGRWSWGTVDLAPGASQLVDVPPGAESVEVVSEVATADLLVRHSETAGILWEVNGLDITSLRAGLPICAQGEDVRLALDAGAAAPVRCAVRFRIRA